MHNVVLFGVSGTGKSSIVNMLVGSRVAEISSDALSCTLRSSAYEFEEKGRRFRIHDTAGLNEGEADRDPDYDAIVRLYKLLYELSDGVSLLVFVMRAPRIRNSVQYNWTLFHDIICRRRVPILLVITGLEEEESMDAWWQKDDNWDSFRRHGVHFCAMAGITASRGKCKSNGTYTFQEEYDESLEKLRYLIWRHHLLTPWKVERVKWLRKIYEAQYRWWDLFGAFPRQVLVRKAREEATQRLIAECGMSPDTAEELAEELEKI